MGNVKKEHRVLLVVLLMIALFCVSLWYVRNYYRVNDMIRVKSEKGFFDLTDIDFSKSFVRLEGDVSYLPGILSPEEFMDRESEAQAGNPWYIPSATSCIRIKVPDDRVYTVTASSVDFAHRVYVGGELRFEVGVPAENTEDFVPGYGQMTLEVTPKNGIIEIVQQGANFVHREGGGHSNLYFGRPEMLQSFLALTFGPEFIITGLFAALFLVHLVLFLVRRSYRPNLIFSILCFTWMVRTGVTGAKVFFALYPELSWQVCFRAEYLCLPIASILMVLLAREIFPGVPQKWFIWIVAVAAAGFALLCITVNTMLLSWVLIAFEGFFSLSIVYLCVRFIQKVPGLIKGGHFQVEHTASLIGFILFMAAAINDALVHLGVPSYLGIKSSFIMTGLAMLIFSFFQMTAMFYGTMRETALAHERERKAADEKEMLSEMNRLKSSFYTDMSHEMKTPLTVIAVNAQFAAQNIEAGMVDEETVTDLDAISAEARRLAQMVTSLVGIGRMQGTADMRASLALDSLIMETARIYQSLFARKKNTLMASPDSNLPLVEGNADQIIQVLINLLSNANRHMSSGTVCMQAKALGKKVKVIVTDNGTGIASSLLPHVFERYCHGESGASGLGLPICKAIIEEHGGEMGIESEEGKGTTVWFTLPVKEEKA